MATKEEYQSMLKDIEHQIQLVNMAYKNSELHMQLCVLQQEKLQDEHARIKKNVDMYPEE